MCGNELTSILRCIILCTPSNLRLGSPDVTCISCTVKMELSYYLTSGLLSEFQHITCMHEYRLGQEYKRLPIQMIKCITNVLKLKQQPTSQYYDNSVFTVIYM